MDPWQGNSLIFLILLPLTDGIFETSAYGVPNKSQNPTDLGQGGQSSTQCSPLKLGTTKVIKKIININN